MSMNYAITFRKEGFNCGVCNWFNPSNTRFCACGAFYDSETGGMVAPIIEEPIIIKPKKTCIIFWIIKTINLK